MRVNIIFNKHIVPELIQSQLNTPNLVKHMRQIIDGDYDKDYQNIEEKFETKNSIDPAKYILDKINQSFDWQFLKFLFQFDSIDPQFFDLSIKYH